MKEERGGEKRWYQKPEFIWTIATFALLQGVSLWRSSNVTAAKGAVQQRSFEDLQRGFDSFQKTVIERLNSIDKKQEDWQTEQRRTWQTEHDSNNDLRGKYEQVSAELHDEKAARQELERKLDASEKRQGDYNFNLSTRLSKIEPKKE